MAHSNATAPTTEPTVTQRYQCTNITTTKATINNKEWGFRFWEKEGIIQYFWGSVGKEASNSPKTVYGTLHDAERMAATKTNPRNKPESRYTQVQLQSKAAPPVLSQPQLALTATTNPVQSTLHPDVSKLISYVFNTASQNIKSYLQGTIDALSIDQLNEGRKVIVDARNLLATHGSGSRDKSLLETMNRYYTTIPTMLSTKRISADDRVADFYSDLNKFEDRINQLEAALTTYQYATTHVQQAIDPIEQQYNSLGVHISTLAQSASNYGAIIDFVDRTKMNEKLKIHRIYEVHIPNERKQFNDWVTGYIGNRDTSAANSEMFFHGTRRVNVQYIIKTGIKIMATAANGSRFGRGIYGAPKFARSAMYTDYANEGRYGRNNEYWMMFLTQFALGKAKELMTEDYSLTQAPRGYDSVFSNISHGGRGGEYIVYRTQQQTIRYLLMLEPA